MRNRFEKGSLILSRNMIDFIVLSHREGGRYLVEWLSVNSLALTGSEGGISFNKFFQTTNKVDESLNLFNPRRK